MQNLLLQAVDKFFEVIYFLILIRIVLSWLPSIRNTAGGGIIDSLTEPILGPVREMIDRSPIGGGMMFDFSPVIALFIMKIVCTVVKALIMAVL